jgi:hypothetical protein
MLLEVIPSKCFFGLNKDTQGYIYVRFIFIMLILRMIQMVHWKNHIVSHKTLFRQVSQKPNVYISYIVGKLRCSRTFLELALLPKFSTGKFTSTFLRKSSKKHAKKTFFHESQLKLVKSILFLSVNHKFLTYFNVAHVPKFTYISWVPRKTTDMNKIKFCGIASSHCIILDLYHHVTATRNVLLRPSV